MVALSLAGCHRGSGLDRASVGGEVTLDEKPVQAGSIRFECLDGGPTSGAVIHDGNYYITTDKGPVLGPHRVKISIPQKSGRQIVSPFAFAQPKHKRPLQQKAATQNGETSEGDNFNPMQAAPMTDEWIDAAPAVYGRESTLEVDIKPGRNTFDVSMESD